MNKKVRLLVALALMIGAASAVNAQCLISGDITATATNDPYGPAWAYTLTITWDNDVVFDLSHMDLILDSVGGSCSLADFLDHLSWPDPIGTSDGVGGCTVEYSGDMSDNGDPSIPGVTGIIFKFEPYDNGCEPDDVGTATFVFYSDLAPVPVDEDILSLVDKFAGMYCFGHLTGMFPGMDCDPVDARTQSWGSLKGTFR